MSPTESDIFSIGGVLKKVVACGFFGVLLWLLWLLVGVYVANVAAFAVLLLLLLVSFGSCSAPLLYLT
jgi:hypothetical protein